MGSSAATVIAAHGRTAVVQLDDGRIATAQARNRQLRAVCGDAVTVRGEPGGTLVIESIATRRTEFARASESRTKVIAANVTQVAVLVACEPPFSDELVCRFLVAAAHQHLPVVIVLNKIDLATKLEAARDSLAPFVQAGCTMVEICARNDIARIRPLLATHRTLLLGQSGMGKSTLVKRLVPDADVRIGEISRFLGTGRQTTTAARLYRLDDDSDVVDTPGVSEFGLAALSGDEIRTAMGPLFDPARGCRFLDCRHVSEPDCGVRAATLDGSLHPRRLELYRRILRLERPH